MEGEIGQRVKRHRCSHTQVEDETSVAQQEQEQSDTETDPIAEALCKMIDVLAVVTNQQGKI